MFATDWLRKWRTGQEARIGRVNGSALRQAFARRATWLSFVFAFSHRQRLKTFSQRHFDLVRYRVRTNLSYLSGRALGQVLCHQLVVAACSIPSRST